MGISIYLPTPNPHTPSPHPLTNPTPKHQTPNILPLSYIPICLLFPIRLDPQFPSVLMNIFRARWMSCKRVSVRLMMAIQWVPHLGSMCVLVGLVATKQICFVTPGGPQFRILALRLVQQDFHAGFRITIWDSRYIDLSGFRDLQIFSQTCKLLGVYAFSRKNEVQTLKARSEVAEWEMEVHQEYQNLQNMTPHLEDHSS